MRTAHSYWQEKHKQGSPILGTALSSAPTNCAYGRREDAVQSGYCSHHSQVNASATEVTKQHQRVEHIKN